MIEKQDSTCSLTSAITTFCKADSIYALTNEVLELREHFPHRHFAVSLMKIVQHKLHGSWVKGHEAYFLQFVPKRD